MKIERGEIWWVNLDPTVGAEIKKRRPCVVLSANEINRVRATPVVVPLSSSPTAAPPVLLSVLDQIRAVDKKRFVSKAGTLNSKDMEAIEAAAKQVLHRP